MSESRLATKVGLFVFLGLTALGVLLLNFSKSGDWFSPTYKILLRTSNVGGIKKRASVLMAGVPVGYVESAKLAPDSKTVVMTVCIYQEFQVRRSALFAIEQAGFLGDQYVAIIPRDNRGALLQAGDLVRCEPPFDLQDTARRASDLLGHVGNAVTELKTAISNVQGSLLSHDNLTNIATNIVVSLQNIRVASESVRSNVPVTLTNIHGLSDNAAQAVKDLQTLVANHTASVSRAIGNLQNASSNVATFAENLKRAGASIEQIIETNRLKVDATLKNIETASVSVTNMLTGLQADLDAGKGLVGGLLKDQEMKQRTDLALSNIVSLSSNLDLAAGNLNRHGLWWMLWKPKYPKTNTATRVKSGEQRW
jgi:phospholipid/cholesterol/gamma-HCH transport system substrate-binding protein